jgi:plastocyanin
MRSRLLLFCALLTFATGAFAKDVFLSIGGTVNNFHTDARIFNPSGTKDITIQAYFLPAGLGNNSGVTPVSITIPKRSMKVYDDVVTAIFNASGIGAIRLTSDDDFVATSRIYAVTASGTLGQFVQGLDATSALKAGVLLQGKSTSGFRTNIGAANPNNATANVTWRLYDKNNALIGTPKVEAMAPFAVLGPANFSGYLGAGSADLTDAWVSFTSDQPIFAYFSVIDNLTTDPTYIPAAADSGSSSNTTNPAPKTFNVAERSFAISITPAPVDLQPGDAVTFNISGQDTTHGFELISPTGNVLIDTIVSPGAAAQVKKVTLTQKGTYLYTCTISTCGEGHGNMVGTFDVGDGSGGPGDPGYN